MKEIMKKVSVLKGVTLSAQDMHDSLEEIECYMDKGCFIIRGSNKMTVKVNGKIIESKNLTVSFEDVE